MGDVMRSALQKLSPGSKQLREDYTRRHNIAKRRAEH